MTQNHWYITIILSTLRVSNWGREGVGEVSGFWNKRGTLVKTPICDTSPTPIRYLFDTLSVGILPLFGHISDTFLPILRRCFSTTNYSFRDPVAVIRAPLISILLNQLRFLASTAPVGVAWFSFILWLYHLQILLKAQSYPPSLSPSHQRLIHYNDPIV